MRRMTSTRRRRSTVAEAEGPDDAPHTDELIHTLGDELTETAPVRYVRIDLNRIAQALGVPPRQLVRMLRSDDAEDMFGAVVDARALANAAAASTHMHAGDTEAMPLSGSVEGNKFLVLKPGMLDRESELVAKGVIDANQVRAPPEGEGPFPRHDPSRSAAWGAPDRGGATGSPHPPTPRRVHRRAKASWSE